MMFPFSCGRGGVQAPRVSGVDGVGAEHEWDRGEADQQDGVNGHGEPGDVADPGDREEDCGNGDARAAREWDPTGA